MAVDTLSPLAPAALPRGRELEPRPAPGDPRRGGRPSCCPRWPAREPTVGYLFYDCQTDDVRLVLTVLGGGRALRRGVRQPARGHRAASEDGRAAGVRPDARRAARSSWSAPPTSSTPPACGPTAAPERAARRGRGAGHPARAAARTSSLPRERLPHRRRRDRCPRAAGARSSRCPGSAGRSIGTTDNDYEGDARARPARRATTSTTCSTRSTSSSAPRLGPGGHRRRLRRRAAADLHRRPARSRSTSRARPSCTRPRAG